MLQGFEPPGNIHEVSSSAILDHPWLVELTRFALRQLQFDEARNPGVGITKGMDFEIIEGCLIAFALLSRQRTYPI
jgi:hypothetical protein